MTLNVLISTIDSGINNIKEILLLFRSDVKYIISHQYRNDKYLPIPEKLQRDDVIISQIPGPGLSKSRNNAIKLASGDICVIADDDVRYTHDYFDSILGVYEDDSIDIACFKIFTGHDSPSYKKYPAEEYVINSISTYSPSSIEITFRLLSIHQKSISFDERFGLGFFLAGGEEAIFITDALKAKLKIQFYPHYIVQHPFESTIKSFPKYHQKRVRVTGATDSRINGYVSLLKTFAAVLKFLTDLLKNKKNPLLYIYQRLSGNIYILKPNKKIAL